MQKITHKKKLASNDSLATASNTELIEVFFGATHRDPGRELSEFLSAYYLGIENSIGKQGRGNQPPYRRYGPDTEIQYRPREPHGLAKTSRILSKTEADTEFQYRPRIVDTDTIADLFKILICRCDPIGSVASWA